MTYLHNKILILCFFKQSEGLKVVQMAMFLSLAKPVMLIIVWNVSKFYILHVYSFISLWKLISQLKIQMSTSLCTVYYAMHDLEGTDSSIYDMKGTLYSVNLGQLFLTQMLCCNWKKSSCAK